MLLTKEVETTINPKTYRHYKELGYEFERVGDTITVKVEDLPNGSNIRIDVMCDYCNEPYSIIYNKYYKKMKSDIPKCCCENCWNLKLEEYNILKYGVENVSCLDEIKEKKKKTLLEHYGVEYPFQSEELYSHMGDVLQERYGTRNCMQSKEIRQKVENTMLEKYGFKNPNQVPEIREKINKTNIERYGGISPICSEDVKLKCRESMYKNSTVSTSTQQMGIYNIIKSKYPQTELNYPIGKKFSGDIVIDNIDFEVDYGGHNLSVKLGEITQDDFDKNQMIRDKIVKSCGYKVIRLIADNTRKIPSDEILLKILEQSKEYFNTTNHTWVEYNIDTSLMRNAENKEGIFFNFGELRKIKKIG